MSGYLSALHWLKQWSISLYRPYAFNKERAYLCQRFPGLTSVRVAASDLGLIQMAKLERRQSSKYSIVPE